MPFINRGFDGYWSDHEIFVFISLACVKHLFDVVEATVAIVRESHQRDVGSRRICLLTYVNGCLSFLSSAMYRETTCMSQGCP